MVIGALPRIQNGAPEPLLLRLEEGALDLVAGGAFAANTTWVTRLTLGPALHKGATVAHHMVARSGENACIMLIAREAHELGHGS